jgi:hypothetical protein
MKKYLILLVFILLIGCSDSSEKKAQKSSCEAFSKKLSNIDMQKCIKDKTYFDNLTISYTTVLQIDYIEKFNNNINSFNSVDVGVNDEEYALVNINNFLNDNKISTIPKLLLLNEEVIRKKIKFKSYFEVNLAEEEKEYQISFYDKFSNMISVVADKKQSNIPELSEANFQNVEIKKKYEDFVKDGFSNSFTGVDFNMPLSNNQSVIYGYFLNNVYSGLDILTNKIHLLLNDEIDFDDIANKKITISEFFVTDIKFEKISYTQQEVIDFVKKDELGLSRIRFGLKAENLN